VEIMTEIRTLLLAPLGAYRGTAFESYEERTDPCSLVVADWSPTLLRVRPRMVERIKSGHAPNHWSWAEWGLKGLCTTTSDYYDE